MNCLKNHCRSPVACGGFGYCRERNQDGRGMGREAIEARRIEAETNISLRDAFAQNVREAIAEQYPAVFFPGIDVTLAATTSDCPLIRADLGNGEVYHVTITRARP